ncbi:HORMA domain containing protein [Amanita muscaria]
MRGTGRINFLNFEGYFTAASDADVSPDPSISSTDHGQRRNVSGFKIMTMTRGYTEEADRILNYLEYGIFDALQKQYLRSFIFAIYLDNKDPNNIVEAYTFNFQYHTVHGTDTVVPILTLGNDLQKMSLNRHKDPVAEATLKGKVPTLKEVKKSVKSLLKTLIHAMTQMDVLPKRRYATFKLFYTDKTPPEYEPPHFQAGDAEKDKWYFMTHDLDEVPDRWSIGRVDAGHHSVNLSVTSIATYLPSSTKLDDAIFGGTTSQLASATSLTPEQEVCMRVRQTEEQVHDAGTRNVVWAAEGDIELVDFDAEGEDDPDYIKLPNGAYEKKPFDADPKNMAPLGLKNKDGVIEPLHMEVDLTEACYGGPLEVAPSRLEELVNSMLHFDNKYSNSSPQANHPILPEVEQTQSIEKFVPAPSTVEDEPEIESVIPGQQYNQSPDTIMQNAPDSDRTPAPESAVDKVNSCPGVQEMSSANHGIDKGLDCECGVKSEDVLCFCEGGCGRWYHIWCMGYHSIKDNRLPVIFVCFDCRLRADLSWELVKVDLYPKILSKYRELALFRRAIKIAELKKPKTANEFSKFFDSDHGLARQLFKRLEAEGLPTNTHKSAERLPLGFIVDQSTVVDDFGFTETHTKNAKNKGKDKSKATKRKAVQKSVFVFNRAAKTSQAYTDYFNPDPEIESRLLRLSELKASSTIHPASTTTALSWHARDESQTQEETQPTALASLALDQEPYEQECNRPRKKTKISVATGVDLAE